jgi:hypothetical protein
MQDQRAGALMLLAAFDTCSGMVYGHCDDRKRQREFMAFLDALDVKIDERTHLIKQDNGVFVVEIKGDEEIGDPSPENVKKHEFATAHFQRLNEWLKEDGTLTRYQFNMLTPRDYGKFFMKLREGDLVGFRSELDVAMAKATGAPG